MNKIILFLGIFGLFNSAQASYLSQLISEVKGADKKKISLQGKKSVVDTIQLQYGQEYNSTEQSYDQHSGMRLKLNALSNFNNNTRYNELQIEKLEYLQNQNVNQKLSEVYTLYLKVFFGGQELQQLKELLNITKDKIKVYGALRKKRASEINNYLRSQRKELELTALITSKETELDYHLKQLSALVGQGIILKNIRRDKFVSLDKIEKMLTKAQLLKTTNFDLRESELEYSMEKNNLNKIIDRIDITAKESEFRSSDNSENSISMRVIINLPFGGDQSSLQNKYYRKLLAEYESQGKKKVEKLTFEHLKKQILDKITSVKATLENGTQKESMSNLKIYGRSKGVSPLLLLGLKENIVENELFLIQSKSAIYKGYISFLTSRLSLYKYRNSNVLSSNFLGVI